jgi:hypothetical protein
MPRFLRTRPRICTHRWLNSLRQLGQLKEFRLLIEAELLHRPAGYGASISGQKPSLSPSQAAVAVRDLVSVERRILEQGATFQQANEMMSANPELLVSRIVRHFQQLFGVKNMEGLFPKINEGSAFVGLCRLFRPTHTSHPIPSLFLLVTMTTALAPSAPFLCS